MNARTTRKVLELETDFRVGKTTLEDLANELERLFFSYIDVPRPADGVLLAFVNQLELIRFTLPEPDQQSAAEALLADVSSYVRDMWPP